MRVEWGYNNGICRLRAIDGKTARGAGALFLVDISVTHRYCHPLLYPSLADKFCKGYGRGGTHIGANPSATERVVR